MDVNLVRTALPTTIAGVLKVSDVHDNPIKGNTGNGDGIGLNKVLKTDNNGVLQVNNIGGGGATDLSARTTITDDSTSTFLKCDNNGVLETSVNRLQGLTDIDDITTKKNVKVESSGALKVNNEEINIGNSTIASGGSLQQVLIYGRKNDGTLEPLECSGDRLLVDVVELAASGAISTSTALSAVQVCGKGDDNKFKTLSSDNNGVLNVNDTNITDGTQKTKLMAQVTGASDVQLQSDPNGVLVVQNQPTRGQILISGAAISTWNNNAYSDTLGMGNFQVLTVHISCVSSSLNQTENFIVEGTDDEIPSGSSNYYPYKVLKPQSGATNNFYKATFLFPYQNFRIQNRTGSNQGLLNSEGSFYMLSNGSGTEDLDKDSTNKLNVVSISAITRGEIGGMTDGTGSGLNSGSSTTPIDMGDNGTIHFHIQGSFTQSHSGLILLVSNDNSNFVKEQQFSVQQIAGSDCYKGSFTSGFRYIKFENGGADITSTTFKQYAIYNT